MKYPLITKMTTKRRQPLTGEGTQGRKRDAGGGDIWVAREARVAQEDASVQL